MLKNRCRYAFFALITCLVLTGCAKRYWYRVKIYDFHRPKTPANIRIVNLSSDRLNKALEQNVKKACIKQLKKEGYIQAVRDSARFEFVLTMWIDTFEQSYLMEHTYWKDGSRAEPISYPGGTARINNKSKAPTIIFRCNMSQVKPISMTMWDNRNDMYFLNNRFRDILRSKGMVKYMIRTANDR